MIVAMSRSDQERKIRETQQESSSADEPDESSSPPSNDEPKRLRSRESWGPEQGGLPPGATGTEDEYESGQNG
jgi:hypothetical protein